MLRSPPGVQLASVVISKQKSPPPAFGSPKLFVKSPSGGVGPFGSKSTNHPSP